MAETRDEKGPSLKKRLDHLEGELKRLHDKIIQRRLKKFQSSYNSNESITLESNEPGIPVGAVTYNWIFQQWRLFKHLTRDAVIERIVTTLPNPTTGDLDKNKYLPRARRRNLNDEGKDWYNCLRSIRQSIAQGSDAIRRIASLTDITTMNETFSSLMPYATEQESFGSKAIAPPGHLDRDLLAYHVNTGLPVRSNSEYSAFERTNVSKGLTISRSDAGISKVRSINNTRSPTFQHKSLQECKKNLLQENKHLKDQISLSKGLYQEVEALRKKLKEETRKRQIAERKSTEVLKTTNVQDSIGKPFCNKLKTSTSIDEKRNDFFTHAEGRREEPITKLSERIVSKKTSEELPVESRRSLIEKKYVEEREKRIELEGIVSQFREELNSKTKECAQISVGQKLALALAEQFRAKYEKDSRHNSSDEESYLMKALKDSNRECLKLQEELSRLNNNQELSMTNAYKERALRAEVGLKSLQKCLEQYSKQNPLESKVVQSVLEKHKQAYSELLLSKKCSEAEYKARCRRLEGEVARLHAYYEKRIRTLNDRIKELVLQLQEKIICIDSITNSRDNCDVVTLKKTVSEMNVEARQRDAEIGALNAIITDKDNYAKMIEKQKEEAMEKLTYIQRTVGELQSELDNKNAEIGRLLGKIQEKSEEIAIKEKLLTDHSETVTTLRKTLNEIKKGNDQSREDLVSQLEMLKEENAHLLENVNEMAQTILETEKFREGQEKNMFLLQQLEKQVYDRQEEWEHQLSTMSKEKDQAIQTAKFATQKLVSAVGEYESQLKAHKQLQHLLKASLQEKDLKLQQAINELQMLNREAALAEEKELIKSDFQKKFSDVCKVYSDVIDQYPDISSDYS